MKNVAVVAHFDPNDVLDENFKELLSCLEAQFDEVILVSTSQQVDDELAEFTKLTLIIRPNIGYDFYSYKVGMYHARQKHHDISRILLINSSIYILDKVRFAKALREVFLLGQNHNVVGLTASRQVEWHIQSYFLFLDQDTFYSQWFERFFEKVQPLNSKAEIIFRYEVGLSREIVTNSTVIQLFQPSVWQLWKARIAWVKWLVRTDGLRGIVKPGIIGIISQVNLTHFAAKLLADQYGYVKSEVLRDNPHEIDLSFVSAIVSQGRKNTVALSKRYSLSNHKSSSASPRALAPARYAAWKPAGVEGVRLAVVLHLYYADLADEICSYLRNILDPFDIYVTTPFEGDVPRIFDAFSKIAQSVTVVLCENRGRDIGPFVSLYRSGLLDRYAAVLKLHSKKSKYSEQGFFWRDQLFSALAGSSLTVMNIVNLLDRDNVGIVGPHRYYLTDDQFWGANRDMVGRLLRSALYGQEEAELGFFAGSMFWFKPLALRLLKNIPESDLQFEPELGKQDGTLAHALERVVCPLARRIGYRTTSVSLEGEEIHETDTLQNRVPVL